MANFALTTGDPPSELISSVNYLLATQGQGANVDLGNTLQANVISGQITTAIDPNYLAYLYQYMDVRYADSADGSVNFSTSPTNRLYFGVRNYSQGNIANLSVFTTTSTWTCPANVTTISMLMVGGGGAGGSGGQGGGGGGGAVYYSSNVSVTPNVTYTITVGAGGSPSLTAQANGSATSFSFTSNSTLIYTVLGGGGGGGELSSGANASVARNGGSGGGGSHPYFANGVNGYNSGFNLNGANTIQSSTYGYGQGTNGGAGRGQQPGVYGTGSNLVSSSDFILVGGGGGGANVAGQDYSWTPFGTFGGGYLTAGNGGAGFGSNITGNLTYYGGGGAGGLRPGYGSLFYTVGAGGIGGGQGNIPQLDGNVSGGGTINSGGGGAGVATATNSGPFKGGSGGSGIVILGVYENTSSSNPTDYIWTQVSGGGFGSNRFLYYQTNGGRQIQFQIDTSLPNFNFVQTQDAVTIDLDVITSTGAIDASTISVAYDNTQIFSRDVNNVWTPNINANGILQTNATITVTQANTILGQITRTINYNPNYANVTITGGSTTMPNIGVVEKDGYTYFCYYNPSDNGNLVVTGGNVVVDVFLVGGGANGQTINSLSMGGEGGEGKYYPNVTLVPGNHFVSLSGGGPTQFSNANLYGASAGTYTTSGFGNRRDPARGFSNTGAFAPYTVTVGNANVWFGGNGTPDPWGTIDWILEPPRDNNPKHYIQTGIYNNWYGDQVIYDSNGLAWFGGGGGSNQSQFTTPGPYPAGSPGYGGLGGGGSGGGSIYPYAGNLNPANYWTGPGIYGGGGSASTTYAGALVKTFGSSGIAIIRVNNNYLSQWWIDGNTAADIDGNNFIFGSNVTSDTNFFQPIVYSNSSAYSNIAASLSVAVVTAGQQGNVGIQGNRGFIPLAYILTPSSPAVASNATLSGWFSANRDNVSPPIGTGFTPELGDTAQFFYAAGNVSAFKTYDGTGWSNVTGQVIDGNVLVSGTVTANKLAANDIYALNIQSTSATLGSNTSPGFWLQANTGNARFGGGINVGNNLTVGNSATIGTNLIVGANANIGANLFVTGLITTGNLNNNTVNTTTITSNAISFLTGFQDNSDVITIHPNTSLYSLTNTISVTTTVTNTKVLVSGQVTWITLANTATSSEFWTTNVGIRMYDSSVGLTYILTFEEKAFEPGYAGNLIQGDQAYYETGIVLTLANIATYNFGLYGKVGGNANVYLTDGINRRNSVSSLKR